MGGGEVGREVESGERGGAGGECGREREGWRGETVRGRKGRVRKKSGRESEG